jgi:hypothetical protein
MHENFFITQFYVKFLGSKVAEQWKERKMAVNASFISKMYLPIGAQEYKNEDKKQKKLIFILPLSDDWNL